MHVVQGDQLDANLDVLPDRIRTQPQFYVYVKQYMEERAVHVAGLASQVGTRHSFVKVMNRVQQCMSVLEQEVRAALPLEKRRKRPARHKPYYQQHAGAKRANLGAPEHPMRSMRVSRMSF